MVEAAVGHHADAVALLDPPVDDADQDDDAEVGVIPAVDQHRLERRVAVALRGRQAGDDGLQHVGDADAGFGRDMRGFGGVDADDVLDLFTDLSGSDAGRSILLRTGTIS